MKIKAMNKDESIAYNYLALTYDNLIPEPDSKDVKIPPDISINRTIGVEVRRLNQQFRANGKSRGLENDSINLEKIINEEFKRHLFNGNCYWASLHYARRFNEFKFKEIKKNLQKAIKKFEIDGEKLPFSFNIDENIEIIFEFATKENASQKYEIATELDNDSGGWVISMYTQEITECMEEKAKKIQPYFDRYKLWWLLLVDHIGFLREKDVPEIVSQVAKLKCFDKVLLINITGDKLLLEI